MGQEEKMNVFWDYDMPRILKTIYSKAPLFKVIGQEEKMKDQRLNEALVLIDRAKELVDKSFKKVDYIVDELTDVAGYLDDLKDEIERVTKRWEDEDGEDDTDPLPLESERHKYDPEPEPMFDTLEERDGDR